MYICLNQMPLATTIEGKSKCYRRRKPRHLPGRSLVGNNLVPMNLPALSLDMYFVDLRGQLFSISCPHFEDYYLQATSKLRYSLLLISSGLREYVF